MPFVDILDPRFSDVVLQEAENLYSRDTGSVTNTAGGVKALGTVIWRAKSTDPTAQWDVVDAVGDLNIANEYAILIGDKYSVKDSITLGAAVATPVLMLAREARVKEGALKAIHVAGGFTLSHFEQMKHLLKLGGITVETTNTPIA